VVVPAARADEVLETAERIEGAEAAIRAAIEAGTPLGEARRAAGYHDLQRRR
jgi:regulator of RNase E activity RraA